MNEFIWLHNVETDGYFRCPEAAVEHMLQLGWEPSDPPVEVNPAIAERLAWEAEQAALREKAAAEAAEHEANEKEAAKPAPKKSTATKSARRGDSE